MAVAVADLYCRLGALGRSPIGSRVRFPVSYSGDSRVLVDANGQPFPVQGRALWALVGISAADRATQLSDAYSKGFNAIEVAIPWRHSSGVNVPFDGNGDVPFSKRLDGGSYTGSLTYSNINNEAPDFTQPNETYWLFVDALLNDALANGILAFLFPAYCGYNGGTQGWMAEMRANGATKMTTYGAWIATRYKSQKNIVWMIAGDYGCGTTPFTGSDQSIVQALLDGLTSVGGQQSVLISAEGGTPCIATDLPGTLGSTISLNGAYSYEGETASKGRGTYSHGGIPGYLLEEPYDEEGPDGQNTNPASTQPVRRYVYWGWLGGIGGYIAGNCYIWQMQSGWQSHLSTQAQLDLQRQNAFMRALPWHYLVPQGLGSMGTIVTAGGGTIDSSDYVAAAATVDGARLVAYVPPGHTGSITIDMTKMRGATRSRWWDPTNATYTADATGLSNAGTHAFTTPGNNSAGDADWLLMLDA